jgi:hypothetical protein
MFLVVDKRISITVIACRYGLQESIICFIKKSEDSMRGSVKANAVLSVKISCVNCHNPFLRKMERALCMSGWMMQIGCHGTIQRRVQGHRVLDRQRSLLCPSSLHLPSAMHSTVFDPVTTFSQENCLSAEKQHKCLWVSGSLNPIFFVRSALHASWFHCLLDFSRF